MVVRVVIDKAAEVTATVIVVPVPLANYDEQDGRITNPADESVQEVGSGKSAAAVGHREQCAVFVVLHGWSI